MSAAAIVITGASSGIGAELAKAFAPDGARLVLVARNTEGLRAVAESLPAGTPAPLIVPLDLATPDAPERLRAALAAEGLACETLVNNAGFGLAGRVDRLPASEQIALLRLNIESLTALTLAFLPDITAGRGGILNVASVAAFMPGPGMAAYYASKAFVLSFSNALHQEMKGKGVRVSALCPGPVATGFQDRAGIDFPGPAMPPAPVARAGHRALRRGQRIVVPGWSNKLLVVAAAFLPRAVLLPVVARAQARRLRR